MVPMAVYAVLGGSRALSVSTTSTVASLTGSTLLASEHNAVIMMVLFVVLGGKLVGDGIATLAD